MCVQTVCVQCNYVYRTDWCAYTGAARYHSKRTEVRGSCPECVNLNRLVNRSRNQRSEPNVYRPCGIPARVCGHCGGPVSGLGHTTFTVPTQRATQNNLHDRQLSKGKTVHYFAPLFPKFRNEPRH